MHQLNQITRFWYEIKEENHIFQKKSKTLKLMQLMANDDRIEFVYWFLVILAQKNQKSCLFFVLYKGILFKASFCAYKRLISHHKRENMFAMSLAFQRYIICHTWSLKNYDFKLKIWNSPNCKNCPRQFGANDIDLWLTWQTSNKMEEMIVCLNWFLVAI